MPTEKQIDRALLKSEKRWDKNLRDCPSLPKDMHVWFSAVCYGSDCPLCHLYDCVCENGCPLNDNSVACCKQWDKAMRRSHHDLPIKRNVRAVRDRIRRECDKRGLKYDKA